MGNDDVRCTTSTDNFFDRFLWLDIVSWNRAVITASSLKSSFVASSPEAETLGPLTTRGRERSYIPCFLSSTPARARSAKVR
jgi:hypothetical protein